MSDSSFHIVFCINDAYFRSAGATMLSVIANNPSVHFTFHILTFTVADEHKARLLQLEKEHPVKTHIHLLAPELFSEFAHFIESTAYPLATFTRLFVSEALKDYTDRVLYLDADVLCVGKIDEMMALPMTDAAYVIPDAPRTVERRSAVLKLAEKKYFNSGVMYINIPKWREEDITGIAIKSMLGDIKDFRFLDQDALNIALQGKATYIGQRWNYLYALIDDLLQNKRTMRNVGDAVFIHFAGAVKPWADWCMHDARTLFKRYHAMSPWRDMSLDLAPCNAKEMRMQARFLWKRGEFLKSAMWFGKYLRARA